jgi:hypothetical protein
MRGPNFGVSSVRFRYGPPGCLPSVLTRPKWLCVHLAAWGFYVRASSSWVAPRTAGYDYGATWGPAPAGLPPASQAVSFAALPRRGPSVQFPRFIGTMRRSDPLPPVSPCFVAFAWRYHRCVLFAPSGRDVRPWAPGSCSSGSRAGNVGGDGRVSQVPGQPLCPYALFLDPGRTEDARPLWRLDMAPACVNNEGSRDD